MPLSLAEIKLLIEALDTLDLEYDRHDAAVLADRLQNEHDARLANNRV